MPRKPRFFIDNMPVLVVQRGHSREPVFFEDQDYAAYIHWLGLSEAALRYGVSIHCFCLMTNHVHLLLTPQLGDALSRFVQFVGRHLIRHPKH